MVTVSEFTTGTDGPQVIKLDAKCALLELRVHFVFDVVCTVHHPTVCTETNKMHKILAMYSL